MKIIPTILANDVRGFKARFKKVVPIADEIQIDLMDGRFVPTTSIKIEDVPSVRRWKRKRFEAHLMVKEPIPLIPPLASRGFARVIVHYEAIWKEDIPQLIKLCKKLGIELFLALNPGTSVAKIAPYARDVDGILFLGVPPGHNGAPYIASTPGRVRQLRKLEPSITIQVDGGMTPETIKGVVRAGANRVNTGSYVGSARDPKKALERMYDASR